MKKLFAVIKLSFLRFAALEYHASVLPVAILSTYKCQQEQRPNNLQKQQRSLIPDACS